MLERLVYVPPKKAALSLGGFYFYILENKIVQTSLRELMCIENKRGDWIAS
jgi:hypothetical protein